MLLTIKKIIKKFYPLIIVLTLFVSYGQTLLMLPWQDDNALFFKLAHIQEPAGFLGKGIFGEWAYKYTAFFYYPIYKIFGYHEFYYFALGFILYGVSAAVVYKVASKLFDENSGKLVGFLYACGFIGSDSFIRLFNSVITSISVILVCYFLNSYWFFYKKKQLKWYFSTLLFFFLAAEFARSRTHYLIALPIIFELFFLSFKKPFLKSFVFSILRMLPFLPIFYRYVILEDPRSKVATDFVLSLLRGDYFKTFGFLSSLTNLVLPNWLINILSPQLGRSLTNSYFSNSSFYYLIIGVLIIFVSLIVFLKFKKFRRHSLVFILFSICWYLISNKIFINPMLVVTPEQVLISFIGGEIIFSYFFSIFFINEKYRLFYIFFGFGVLINLASYAAYSPTQVYEKINRYLSHSFLYLVFLLGFIYYSADKKIKNIVLIIITIWGISNLCEGYSYQNEILKNRTAPVRSFYNDFHKFVSKVNKGDILYFDVEDKMRASFENAFSVAQMPDTTAIAWRYGIDRDDFKMFENPEDFFNYINQNKFENKQIRTFFYTKDGLIETTKSFLSLYKSGSIIKQNVSTKSSEYTANKTADGTWIGKSEVEIQGLDLQSMVPVKIDVDIIGTPLSFEGLVYPIHYGLENIQSPYSIDQKVINTAFEYKKYKNEFRMSNVFVTSSWQGRIGKNLIDGDIESNWQADRLLWLKSDQTVTITVPRTDSFDRLAFINSYSDNTPLEFDMFYSNDGVNWSDLATYRNSRRLENNGLVIVNFDKKTFKYLKIHFKKTLNGDSPAISEMWLIPDRFTYLDIPKTEIFLNNVFSLVPDYSSYLNLLNQTNYKGNVDLYWSSDKSFGWKTDAFSNTNVVFDGRVRTYEISIPPGGRKIDDIKFIIEGFPGKVTITGIKARY